MKKHSTRSLTALFAIGAILIAGCTSGDSDTGSPDPTTTVAAADDATTDTEATEPPATESTEAPDTAADETTPDAAATETTVAEGPPEGLTGPAPGVTDDTIKVGITYIDFGSVDVGLGGHGDYEGSYHAVIDAINARGGINGRMIEPVIAPIQLGGTGNADAVCVQLTEDEDVFVVTGFFFADAPACYLETHETALIGGTMNDDLLGRAKAPWYTWEPSNDSSRDGLRAIAEAGYLDGTIGVYVSSDQQAIVDAVVVPTLAEFGITPIEVGVNDALTDDQVLSDAQNAAILQRFEVAGVDTILAPGSDVVGALSALETASYRPRVAGTDFNSALAFALDAGRDRSVLEGFVTTGSNDFRRSYETDPQATECIDTVKAAGVEYFGPDEWTEGEPEPWVSATVACSAMTIFEAIATKAGPDLNYATFQWAGDNLGELKLPFSPEPYFFGAPAHADGDMPMFVYTWDEAAQELVVQS